MATIRIDEPPTGNNPTASAGQLEKERSKIIDIELNEKINEIQKQLNEQYTYSAPSFSCLSLSELDQTEPVTTIESSRVSTARPRLRHLQVGNLPLSMRKNSEREELVNDYVLNFQRQFVRLYPTRPKLFLFPENEARVTKYVGSFIRPTKLEYKELLEYEGCGRFVADFIQYVPLARPGEFPKKLISPVSLLNMQEGTCFDLSTLLVSLLRGAGYNAYVVSGFALKEVTIMDLSNKTCPLLEANTHIIKEEKKQESFSYDKLLLRKPGLVSQFVTKKEEEEERKRLAELAQIDPNLEEIDEDNLNDNDILTCHKDVDEDGEEDGDEDGEEDGETAKVSTPEPDPHLCTRRHCWVLVTHGSRGIEKNFFIEPSTGDVVDIEDTRYLWVESIWNNQNYWINMQRMNPNSLIYKGLDQKAVDDLILKGGCSLLSFDTKNEIHWERIFLDSSKEDLTRVLGGEILHPEPSWVPKITLDMNKLEERYPTGRKLLSYNKCEWTRIAPYYQDDGMVTKLVVYADTAYKVPQEIKEFFESRCDHLEQRRRIFQDFPKRSKQTGKVVYLSKEVIVHETFAPGRPSAIHERIIEQFPGKPRRITLSFFPDKVNPRTDGLVRRVDTENIKIKEYFEEREDGLIYRSATYKTPQDYIDYPPFDDEFINGITLTDHSAKTTSVEASNVLAAEGEEEPKHESQIKDNENGQKNHIKRMSQKFSRNPNITPDQDVEKVTFNLLDEEIEVKYHRQPGKLISSSCIFKCDGTLVQNQMFDSFAKKKDIRVLEEDFHMFIQMQKQCLISLRGTYHEAFAIGQTREIEEKNIQLVVSIYDTVRNKHASAYRKELELQRGNETSAPGQGKIDYLAPYLNIVFQEGESITREKALLIKDLCMKSLKDRILNKEKLMHSRLEKETAALHRKQMAWAKKHENSLPGPDALEQHNTEISNMKFSIGILESRIAKHDNEALEKYMRLDRDLSNDPRLKQFLGPVTSKI